jgi:DNA-binding XRE family transcriptional regulator
MADREIAEELEQIAQHLERLAAQTRQVGVVASGGHPFPSTLSTGERVTRARNDAELTQAELAAKAGVHINTIYRVESDAGVPNERTLRRLAHALEIDWRWLDGSHDQ